MTLITRKSPETGIADTRIQSHNIADVIFLMLSWHLYQDRLRLTWNSLKQ